MKEKRLGPRQWAFVVVAGGTVFSLPFMQRRPEPKPEIPAVDSLAAFLPEVAAPLPTVVVTTAGHAAKDAQRTDSSQASSASVPEPPTTTWPALAHSPFDELVQKRAVVIDAKPTEEIVPMIPLRPWISAPNLNDRGSQEKLASSSVPSVSGNMSPLAGGNGQGKLIDSVAQGSPWRDDDGDNHADKRIDSQVVTSYGHGRKQLPVSAGPADQYTVEELAQKLNLSPHELAAHPAPASRDQLMSAIVPADQVLPPSPSTPKSSVVLSRQPVARPLGAQVRFGQSNPQTPLPALPEERRGHVIVQPKIGQKN